MGKHINDNSAEQFDIMLDEFLTNELNKYLVEKEYRYSTVDCDREYDSVI